MQSKDDILKELYQLEQDVKPKIARIEELKALCREWGSCSSKDYICSVMEVVRNQLAPIAEVIEAVGSEKVEKLGLIRMVRFKVVKVLPKQAVIEKEMKLNP